MTDVLLERKGASKKPKKLSKRTTAKNLSKHLASAGLSHKHLAAIEKALQGVSMRTVRTAMKKAASKQRDLELMGKAPKAKKQKSLAGRKAAHTRDMRSMLKATAKASKLQAKLAKAPKAVTGAKPIKKSTFKPPSHAARETVPPTSHVPHPHTPSPTHAAKTLKTHHARVRPAPIRHTRTPTPEAAHRPGQGLSDAMKGWMKNRMDKKIAHHAAEMKKLEGRPLSPAEFKTRTAHEDAHKRLTSLRKSKYGA
jgi:hypothetical protein